jgi:8-oxo-dGTP diphosphatase
MGKRRGKSEMDFGIRVGAVVKRDGALLLVRHEKPGREPYWVLPGGRLEPGETIPKCAEREVAEEVGLEVGFSEVLYVSEFLTEGRHTVDITARVEPRGEEEAVLGSDPEVAPEAAPTLKELRWVGLDELEEINLLPAWIRDRLVRDARGRSTGEVYVRGGGD